MSPPDAALGAGAAAGSAAWSRAAVSTGDEEEVARVLRICNACRYCEGFCAVFPAMTRRLEFGKADVHYLANLCHSCGACLHACQYAPPHEFMVNVPRAMAAVRRRTYADFAWPHALSVLYRRNGAVLALAVAFGVALFLLLALAIRGWLVHPPLAGNFYAVLPHGLMASLFGAAFAFALVALGIGVARFWRGIAPGPASYAAVDEASADVLRLTYLGGGHGEGCNNEDDRFTLARRRFHHLAFYGFLLCFAATCVATIYHFLLDYPAPYPFLSVPVLLGAAGGLGLLLGPAGLLWLNLRRHPLHREAAQNAMDRGFMLLLFASGATGLLLLAWRDSRAMATLLALHLGVVLALFLTMPYGKFAHAAYRCAALLKWTIEKRQPNPLTLSEE